jgi:hypothetical protein
MVIVKLFSTEIEFSTSLLRLIILKQYIDDLIVILNGIYLFDDCYIDLDSNILICVDSKTSLQTQIAQGYFTYIYTVFF